MSSNSNLIDLNQLIDPIKAGIRHEILTDKLGRQYLYNDSHKGYEALKTQPIVLQPIERHISTVETLALVVKEEATRRTNTTGEHMTLLLDDKGATFIADDHDGSRHEQWRYKRAQNQTWNTLIEMLDRQFTSLAFYKKLLQLSDAIVESQTVLASFQKVRVTDKSEFQDQNHFSGGDYGKKSAIKLTVRGGDDDMELTIPDAIHFKIAPVRGSAVTYDLTALVEITTERHEDKTVARFGLSIPTLDVTREQLLADEANYLREQTKDLPRLLIGMNYG